VGANALIVKFEDADPPAESKTVLELKDVARSPDADSVTVPTKPARLPRVMVDMPDSPCGTFRKSGLAEIVKSGPTTRTLMLTGCDTVPLVPVTVRE